MLQKALSAVSMVIFSCSFLVSAGAAEQASSSKALTRYTANSTKHLTKELGTLKTGLSKEIDAVVKQLEIVGNSGYETDTVNKGIAGLRDISLRISDDLTTLPQDYYELLAKCMELREKLDAMNKALNLTADFIDTAKSSSPTTLKNLNKKRSIGSKIKSKFRRAKDKGDELAADVQDAGDKLAKDFNAKIQELRQFIINTKRKAAKEISKKKQKVKNELNAQRFTNHLMKEVQNNVSGQLAAIIKKDKENILKTIKTSHDKIVIEEMDRKAVVDTLKSSIADRLGAMEKDERRTIITSLERAVDSTIDHFSGASE